MQKVKIRHKLKRLKLSKKFIKRTSRKISVSAVSAATIGTAAVVVTIASLEIYDYCNDKKELLEDGNILFKSNEEFDYG